MRPPNLKFLKLPGISLVLFGLLFCPDRAAFAGGAAAEFDTADAAVSALVTAVRSDRPKEAIANVLGSAGSAITDSGDPISDAARRDRFSSAIEESHKIESDGSGKSTLLIGAQDYPFPIPLVEAGGKWHWDTASGLDAILTRRIGENELSTIAVMRALADAQREYAARDRDGSGPQYARRLMSHEGKKDGLYWPATGEGDESPIGPLIARAQSEGYSRKSEGPPSYHGYTYRMLYGQGPHAPDGARDYIVNDRMIGGFAAIAEPVEYGNSGVMTFIVNQDGDVYEQDFGPDTEKLAGRIKVFDPDASWHKVEQ